MVDLPKTLEAAIAQARTATEAAITAGYTRLQIEILLPELKPMPLVVEYLPVFAEAGADLKVFFTDAGAAALARRDWGEVAFQVASLDVAGSRQTTPVEELIQPSDRAFVFVAASPVEISPVEQVCTAVGERPVVLFNPRLDEVGAVGIGYTARKIRQRFLNTFEPCYYLCPLDEQTVMLRCYPAPWQVWLEQGDSYTLLAEDAAKPNAERLVEILSGTSETQPPKRSLIAEMQRFLKALGQ